MLYKIIYTKSKILNEISKVKLFLNIKILVLFWTD